MARDHSGHSHGGKGDGHGHTHDNVYLTSTNKADAGVRITRIGLYSNLVMAFAKGLGGYYFSSQAMVADAWHSMTDLASDVLTLATVSWSLRPPTRAFPAGFGKVESLGSLGVSGMLLAGGMFMCASSVGALAGHLVADGAAAGPVAEWIAHNLAGLGHDHGHSHAAPHAAHAGPSIHAVWLAAGTVLVKEWLYHATMKVARERKSSVLASNAVHHRVDSLTGIVTLLVILGANFLQNAAWLDPVGGLFISLLVIRAGWGNTLAALYELADRGLDDEVKKAVTRQVQKGLADPALEAALQLAAGGGEGATALVQLRDVGGVKSGQNYLIDLELAVPGDWTVEQVRAVEAVVRGRVGAKVRGARRVRVRFVPTEEDEASPLLQDGLDKTETDALFDEFIPADVSPRSSPEPEAEDDDHGHGHGNGHGHGHAHGKKNR